ncbi:MAG TPA: hypothetical protein VGG46_13375 [Terriglobales bacterium]|jgi:hypothetical protein
MSAYIVDRDHILYLVGAAANPSIEPHGIFRWFHNDKWQELPAHDFHRAAEVANLLWRENIASVSARYPNESSATLPGPCRENFVIEPDNFPIRFTLYRPVQVIKACDCYEYQSCEHKTWQTSEAHAFVSALRRTAWHALPGYDQAEWGAPTTETV